MSLGNNNGGAPSGETHEILNLSEITGGITVNAETGEVSESKTVELEWDEGKLINFLRKRGAEIARTKRRLNSRRIVRANRDTPVSLSETTESETTESETTESGFPRMPRRITAKERRQADAVLSRHSRRFKNNRQARQARRA